MNFELGRLDITFGLVFGLMIGYGDKELLIALPFTVIIIDFSRKAAPDGL